MPFAEQGTLTPRLRRELIQIAHCSIVYGIEHQYLITVNVAEFAMPLQEHRASFVTLTLKGQLRGCIGSLEATRPLVEDVAANAYAAAFNDPRFKPLTRAEYPETRVHLSILSPTIAVNFSSEAELLRQLRPGIDGLVIQHNGQRATFLPSVWESLPQPEDFLRHLKHKAGISDHCDIGTLKAWRYTTESFSE